MEPNSELQMKLRQRLARMGEDSSLMDIANSLPEQDAASHIELHPEVKVKQRRCIFEGAENRHINGNSQPVHKSAAAITIKKEPSQRSPPRALPLRSTSPVEPPIRLSASLVEPAKRACGPPPVRSVSPPSRTVRPVLRGVSSPPPPVSTPPVMSPPRPVVSPQLPAASPTRAARSEMSPHRPVMSPARAVVVSPPRAAPVSPARAVVVSPPRAASVSPPRSAMSPERAGAKPEDALPAPAPEAGRKNMDSIDEEPQSPTTVLTAGVAEAIAASDASALAAFFSILDDSLEESRTSSGSSPRKARRSSAARYKASSKESRASSPAGSQAEDAFEPMEYAVLDYFHSLPPAFVMKLRETIEAHSQEVRYLRSENRELRRLCESAKTTPTSSPSETVIPPDPDAEEAEGNSCEEALGPTAEVTNPSVAEEERKPSTLSPREKTCESVRAAVAAVAAVTKEADQKAHKAKRSPLQAKREIEPEPVTVWMPRAVPEASMIVTQPWPKPSAFSVVSPPSGYVTSPPPPVTQIVSTTTRALSPMPSMQSSPMPSMPHNIAAVARQVAALSSQPPASPSRPVSPAPRPGPPRRNAGVMTPNRRTKAMPTPSPSPARCTTAPTPASRCSAGTPPQLPTWRAAPMVSATRMLAFEAPQISTPSASTSDPIEFCKQRARDERAEVSGAQALISQLSDAIRAAHEKCRRSDVERWALVHEAMQELAQLPDHMRRSKDLHTSTPGREQYAKSRGRRAANGRYRTPSTDARRQAISPAPYRGRGCELDTATRTSPLRSAASLTARRARSGQTRKCRGSPWSP